MRLRTIPLAVLAAVSPLAAPAGCSTTVAETDCYEIVGTDISVGGGVTTGGVRVEVADDEACPLLSEFEFTAYNEQDNVAGYDPAGQDVDVNTWKADTDAPTTELVIGQFSSASQGGGVGATHWQATITDAQGGTHTFSGNFG